MLKKIETKDAFKNVIMVGATGSGKVRHPWDYISHCECGCESPIMYHSNGEIWQLGDSREDVIIKCPMCNKYIPKKH